MLGFSSGPKPLCMFFACSGVTQEVLTCSRADPPAPELFTVTCQRPGCGSAASAGSASGTSNATMAVLFMRPPCGLLPPSLRDRETPRRLLDHLAERE